MSTDQVFGGKTINAAPNVISLNDPIENSNGFYPRLLNANINKKEIEERTIRAPYVNRKALLIGINDYENPANNLSGCIADQQDFYKLLIEDGFPRTKIKTLTNEQATMEGIIQGLEWLAKGLRPGDVAIGFASGHGSYLKDENKDETDGFDECFCPYDISWNAKKYVTDDTFHEFLTGKIPKGVRIDFLFDSCHSGTVTRSFSNPVARPIGQARQRFLPPPIDHRVRRDTSIPIFEDVRRIGRSIAPLPREETNNEILEPLQYNCTTTACRPEQVAWELELGGQVRGAFTYHFTEAWRLTKGNLSRGQLYSNVKFTMRERGFEQIPDLKVPSLEAADLFYFRKESQVDRESEVRKRK